MGEPKFLRPSTANKTNLEVAKVFTIIDPRKPLPEAINVQFEYGVINRVLVSSPWMPLVCDHCKEIGHSAKHCKSAPKLCQVCRSVSHGTGKCPRAKSAEGKGMKTRRGRSKTKVWYEISTQREEEPKKRFSQVAQNGQVAQKGLIKLGIVKDFAVGESSASLVDLNEPGEPGNKPVEGNIKSNKTFEVEPDSSDVSSSDSEGEEEGHIIEEGESAQKLSEKQK